MNRRRMLQAMAAGLGSSCLDFAGGESAKDAVPATGMGIVIYALGNNSRWLRQRGQEDLSDPLTYLDYCCQLGAGGVQLPLGSREADYNRELRRKADDSGMFLEGILSPPRDGADLERFEAEVRSMKAAGIAVARTVIIPGRRYERFSTMEEHRTFVRSGVRSLELAEPVVSKHGLRLAVENHKDQRVPERLDLLKRLSSEYIGVCFDVGNSFSLLEDPVEVARAYAPWTATVHLKDQAVQEYDDGFLFADIALGDGFLDLTKMLAIVREANPAVHCSLEVITRDPLKVPCLTEKYWATFADVGGADLARTLRTVQSHSYRGTLPEVSRLPLNERAAVELACVKRSLVFAADHLQL